MLSITTSTNVLTLYVYITDLLSKKIDNNYKTTFIFVKRVLKKNAILLKPKQTSKTTVKKKLFTKSSLLLGSSSVV